MSGASNPDRDPPGNSSADDEALEGSRRAGAVDPETGELLSVPRRPERAHASHTERGHTIDGERTIPSVNRERTIQSRISSFVAIGTMLLLGTGFLFWYYSTQYAKGREAQLAAQKASAARAGGETKVPPLGRIDPPPTPPQAPAPPPGAPPAAAAATPPSGPTPKTPAQLALERKLGWGLWRGAARRCRRRCGRWSAGWRCGGLGRRRRRVDPAQRRHLGFAAGAGGRGLLRGQLRLAALGILGAVVPEQEAGTQQQHGTDRHETADPRLDRPFPIHGGNSPLTIDRMAALGVGGMRAFGAAGNGKKLAGFGIDRARAAAPFERFVVGG
ncbi:hypothetical protein [Variovorax paradoxus]|uniref:hypothetical protein n=1 Tax=Variovorax paradoxus TaxID=34073 RepID=UPI000A731CA5